ncbi:hypothetical protein GCM10023324_04030 [Streptomyces youssoufiensis]
MAYQCSAVAEVFRCAAIFRRTSVPAVASYRHLAARRTLVRGVPECRGAPGRSARTRRSATPRNHRPAQHAARASALRSGATAPAGGAAKGGHEFGERRVRRGPVTRAAARGGAGPGLSRRLW